MGARRQADPHRRKLWALQVGNGGSGGDPSSVYFTAGLDHQTHGLFGSLTPADPAGTDVLTYHNDTSRTGANLNETTLTPQNVNASDFGKLFRYDLDGQVYAQPLVVSNLKIDGTVHNVLFVATENDSVHALDANNSTAGPHHNGVLLADQLHQPGERHHTLVPSQDVQNNGISPMYGITATPVIDRATKTIYVVQPGEGATKQRGRSALHVQEFSRPEYPHRQGEDGHGRQHDARSPDGSFINNTKLAVAGTGSGSDDGVIKFLIGVAAASCPDRPGARHGCAGAS